MESKYVAKANLFRELLVICFENPLIAATERRWVVALVCLRDENFPISPVGGRSERSCTRQTQVGKSTKGEAWSCCST